MSEKIIWRRKLILIVLCRCWWMLRWNR